jgi:hypothetical protein
LASNAFHWRDGICASGSEIAGKKTLVSLFLNGGGSLQLGLVSGMGFDGRIGSGRIVGLGKMDESAPMGLCTGDWNGR